MKKKIIEISIFEIILSCAVIMIHLLSEGIAKYPMGSSTQAGFFYISKIISFAVPSFIFLSGFKLFYKYKDQRLNYIQFVITRIRKIYVPYLIWVVIYYLFFVYYLKYFNFSLKDLITYIWTGDLVAHFYFIIIIMQFYLLIPIFRLYCKLLNPFWGILLAFAATIIFKDLLISFKYSDRIFTSYLIYWVMGCYVGIYYKEFIYHIKKAKHLLYIASITFTIAYAVITYLGFIGLYIFAYGETLKIVFCISATLALYLFIINHAQKHDYTPSSLIKTVSASTYYIYLSHILVIFFCDSKMDSFNINSIFVRFLIRAVTVYITSFTLSGLYVYLKKKIHA